MFPSCSATTDKHLQSSNNYYFINKLYQISSYEKSSQITPGSMNQSPKFSNDFLIDSPSNLIDYNSKINFASPFSLLTPARRSFTPKLMTNSRHTVQQKEISEFGSTGKSDIIKKITTSTTITNPNMCANKSQKLHSSHINFIPSFKKNNNLIGLTNISKDLKGKYSLITSYNSSDSCTLSLQDSTIKSKINSIYKAYKNIEEKINSNQILLDDHLNNLSFKVPKFDDNIQNTGILSGNITSCKSSIFIFSLIILLCSC